MQVRSQNSVTGGQKMGGDADQFYSQFFFFVNVSYTITESKERRTTLR